MLMGFLRALLTPEPSTPPAPPAPRPWVRANHPKGPGRCDYGYAFFTVPLIDDLEPEDGFPIIFTKERRAI